ncbi:MAG: GNAT family acetyltransferase [Pseudomonadota bacterium]
MIRTFQKRDTDGVQQLWRRVFPDDPPWNAPEAVIRIKSRIQPELFFVYVENDALLGTVIAGFDGVRGWIHKLAVTPEAQRTGIAAALMQEAESALLALGCPKVNLQVRATNEQVIEFYRQAGYHIEERISMGKRLQ